MNKIKKIFLILMLTIINIFVLQLNVFALNSVDEWYDLTWRIKQTAEWNQFFSKTPDEDDINSNTKVITCVDQYGKQKHIMLYKFKAKAASTNWRYATTGYVIHNKPTVSKSASVQERLSKLGVYTPDIATLDIWGGEKTPSCFTENIDTNVLITYADVTDFVNFEVIYDSNFKGNLYLSKILRSYIQHENGTVSEYGPYKVFQEFLDDHGRSPFTSGAVFTDAQLLKKAEDGYYNKEIPVG